jgi:putative pyruvate formate lyase activating enzyme
LSYQASYIKLFENGSLLERVNSVLSVLERCTCCPRNCGVDRKNGEYGICQSLELPIVSSYTAHHGEEPVLSGTRGAGNIFFGNCNLRCMFCQNHEISQNWKVENNNQITYERLAAIMIDLQNRDCHNIGLVSPTHFSAQILKSIYMATQQGLHLPIIYNSNGYDSVEILKLYEDVVDIYLPDFKYGNDTYAKKYSRVDNYFECTGAAIKEMFNQVGDELVYEEGVVVRGLIIRHLVLPNGLAETEKVLKFIAEELSPKVHISLMSQYYPANKANTEPLLSRSLRISEYEKAIELMDKYGLHNGWIQEMESTDSYRPQFNQDRENPFNC